MNNIPKILHIYWDKSPMSWLQTRTVTTFHKHNPDWEIRLYLPMQEYTRSAKYIPDYTGKDYFYLIKELKYVTFIDVDINKYGIDKDLHNILRSDILRYNLLYDHGGLWCDFDILWLKPINDLKSSKTVGKAPVSKMGASLCMFQTVKGHHNIAIMFSKPKHPMYKAFIEETTRLQKKKENKDKFNHQEFGTDMLGIMYPEFGDAEELYDDLVGFPYKVFYPYSIFGLEELYHKTNLSLIDKDVICIHWFNGHKYSKNYVNNEGFEKDCSMTRILTNIGEIN